MDVFLGLPTSAPATPVAMRGVLDDSPRVTDDCCGGSSGTHTPPLPGSVDGALPDFPDRLHSPLTFTTAAPSRRLGEPGGGVGLGGGGADIFGLQRHPPLSTVLCGYTYEGGVSDGGRGGGGGGKAASPPFMQLPCASGGALESGLPLFPPMPPLTVNPVAGATGGVVGSGGGPDVNGLDGCPPGPAATAEHASWLAKTWAGATAGPPLPPLSGLAAGLATVDDLPPPSADNFDLTAALVGAAAGVGDGAPNGGGGGAASSSMQVSPMSPFVVGNPLPSLDGIGSGGCGGIRGSFPLPVGTPMAGPKGGSKRGGKRPPVVGPRKEAVRSAAGPAVAGTARSSGGGGVSGGVGTGVTGGGIGSGSSPAAAKITKKSSGGSKKKKKKKTSGSAGSGGGGAVPQGAGAGAAATAAAAGSRRPRTYTAPVPSMHCHNCSRRPSAESPHYACSNLAVGLCRKTICRRCIYVHGDASAARLPGMGGAPFPFSLANSPAGSTSDPGLPAGRPGGGGDCGGGGSGHGRPVRGAQGARGDSRGGGSGKGGGGGGGGTGVAKPEPTATNDGGCSRDGGGPSPSSDGNPLVIGGDSSSSWVCFHCRGVCPPRAQCHTYARTTVRRRLGQVKHRKPKTTAAAAGLDGPAPAEAACGTHQREERGNGGGSPAAGSGTAPRPALGSAAASSVVAGRPSPGIGAYGALETALPARPPPPKGGRTSLRLRASGGAAAQGAAAASVTPAGRVSGGGSGGGDGSRGGGGGTGGGTGGGSEAGCPAANAANGLLVSSPYPLGGRGGDLATLSQSLIASPNSWSTASMSVEVGSTLPGGPLGGVGLPCGTDDDHPLLLASLDALARVGDGGIGSGIGGDIDGGIDGGIDGAVSGGIGEGGGGGGAADSGTLLAASLSAAAALDSPDSQDLYFPLGGDEEGGVVGDGGYSFGVSALL